MSAWNTFGICILRESANYGCVLTVSTFSTKFMKFAMAPASASRLRRSARVALFTAESPQFFEAKEVQHRLYDGAIPEDRDHIVTVFEIRIRLRSLPSCAGVARRLTSSAQ
jgi:hypothetical protein